MGAPASEKRPVEALEDPRRQFILADRRTAVFKLLDRQGGRVADEENGSAA
jgi:hypothetical protein